MGNKVMRPLLKLEAFDRVGNLDTFLNKFNCMARYLRWDEEDMFHRLCASLEGAAGQVLWDLGPQASPSD